MEDDGKIRWEMATLRAKGLCGAIIGTKPEERASILPLGHGPHGEDAEGVSPLEVHDYAIGRSIESEPGRVVRIEDGIATVVRRDGDTRAPVEHFTKLVPVDSTREPWLLEQLSRVTYLLYSIWRCNTDDERAVFGSEVGDAVNAFAKHPSNVAVLAGMDRKDTDRALAVLPAQLEGPFWNDVRNRLAVEFMKVRMETRAVVLKHYGLRTPWPPREVVDKLADAASHLLTDHDCDAHGHELYKAALDKAREWLREPR